MFNTLKFTAVAAIVAVALPVSAFAATIQGQLDISGIVNLENSDFSATGSADLDENGLVNRATDDFGSFAAFGSVATLTDIDFSAPGDIWSVGGFTFSAISFHSFENAAVRAFTALGVISHDEFDDTAGTLTFTSQENGNAVEVSFSSTTTPSAVPVPAAGLLLVGALGGLGALRRRKKA